MKEEVFLEVKKEIVLILQIMMLRRHQILLTQIINKANFKYNNKTTNNKIY